MSEIHRDFLKLLNVLMNEIFSHILNIFKHYCTEMKNNVKLIFVNPHMKRAHFVGSLQMYSEFKYGEGKI